MKTRWSEPLARMASLYRDVRDRVERSARALRERPPAPTDPVREACIRHRIGDTRGAISSLHAYLLEHPGDGRALLTLAGLRRESGEVELAMRIYREILERPSSGEPDPHRAPCQEALFQLVMRECRRLRATAHESLLVQDDLSALQASERQIRLTLDFLRVLPAGEEPRAAIPVAVTYNHAVATKAFLLWRCGRTAFAEKEILSPASDEEVPRLGGKEWFSNDRWAMYLEIVFEHARSLFTRGNWRDASFAFLYARTKRLEVLRRGIDRDSAPYVVEEAVSEYNQKNYARAHELLTRLLRAAPDYRPDEVRAYRRKAHLGKAYQACSRTCAQAAEAFRAERYDEAARAYFEAANHLESQEGSEFRHVAAECYFNAAMARGNQGSIREAYRLLDYLVRAYPEYEPHRVGARLRRLRRLIEGAAAPGTGVPA